MEDPLRGEPLRGGLSLITAILGPPGGAVHPGGSQHWVHFG